MKLYLRTFGFWFCCTGALFDVVMVFFTFRAGIPAFAPLFLICGALFAVGAWAHWYLDRLLTSGNPRRTKRP